MALPELFANSPTPGTVAFTTKLSAELKKGVTGAKALKVESAAPTSLRGAGQAHFVIDKEIIVVDTGTTNTTEWTILERKAEESTEADHLVASNVYNLITRQTLINAIEERAKAGALGGWINVTESPYNAKGDGVTDDTAAIKSALAALPESGGVLFFPAGKNFSVTLIGSPLRSNVTIIAYGATITQKGSGAGTRGIFENRANFDPAIEYFHVFGGKWIASNEGEGGQFVIGACRDILIADARGEQGIKGFFSSDAGSHERVIVRNNTLVKVVTGAGNAIDVCNGKGGSKGITATQIVITGNHVYECNAAAIAVATVLGASEQPPARIVIADNVVESTGNWATIVCETGGSGAFAPKISDVIIANNMVKTKGIGIEVANTGAAETFTEQNQENILINGNRVTTESSGSGTGILVAMSRRCTISNNIIKIVTKGKAIALGTGGATSTIQREHIITGNLCIFPTTFEGEGGAAVYFAKADQFTFSNNRLQFEAGNTRLIDAVYVEGNVTNFELTDNAIYNAPRHAIFFRKSAENFIIRNNTIRNPGTSTNKGNGISFFEENKVSVGINIIEANTIIDDRGASKQMTTGIATVGGAKEVLIKNFIEGGTNRSTGTFKKVSELTFTE